MKLIQVVCAGLLAAAPMATMAAAGNQVDLFYISGGLEVPGGDDDGDGFGIKGKFLFSENLFLNGEYQTVNYDDSDIDLDQLRLGVGFSSSLSKQASVYGLGEFIRAKLEVPGLGSASENGFGIHGGIQFDVTDAFALNARLGYVDIGDAGDGLEYLIGASFKFNEAFGAFADYRVTKLEDQAGDLDLDDFRVGVRFTF